MIGLTFEQIETLVQTKESDTIELKETTGQLDRAMETICAFLNTKGGWVFFGINDKCHIIGQDVSDKTKRSIAEAVNHFEPVADIKINIYQFPILTVISLLLALKALITNVHIRITHARIFVSRVPHVLWGNKLITICCDNVMLRYTVMKLNPMQNYLYRILM